MAEAAGVVVALQLGPERAGPMRSVERVRVVEGRGIEGDRFFKKIGKHKGPLAKGNDVTLIEAEALEAAADVLGATLAFQETRRNVLVRGVALNALVGRELALGPVRVRVVRLNPPCARLSRHAGKPLVRALDGRGGVKAEVLVGGEIAVGDAVVVPDRSC